MAANPWAWCSGGSDGHGLGLDIMMLEPADDVGKARAGFGQFFLGGDFGDGHVSGAGQERQGVDDGAARFGRFRPADEHALEAGRAAPAGTMRTGRPACITRSR